ncbi:hypothetical protein BT93_L3434 [Corymbia citriodora subsp. variegata]|uniref:Phorbol-ester/DAG-type domain-containing protein n=1 Tax=Corymbia citriodora subsp. variegata TaxID=360336 RepID=A0A8T0CJP4_CORYI|nr:hypothetical protein BT93_L3434 [Corymbia citriodora subsp. variegata]
MEISHVSHEHPLTLCMTEDKDVGEPCNGCSKPIFDLGYVCYDCGFLLHKNCAKLPPKVHHRLHPKHPLTLHFDSSETFECSVCNETGSGFAFLCGKCQFIMDVTCFLRNQPYLDLPPLEGKTRKLQHFSHDHTLTLCYITQQSERNCEGCEQQISGPAYCCKDCDKLTLHKSCAQWPSQVEHPFHPAHSLTLFTESPYPAGTARCDACRKTIRGFVYHCDKCSFDLDLVCASLTPSLKHEKHDHLLTFFEKIYDQVSCDSCGKPCRNNLYRCVSCKFNVHSTCVPFPITVEHRHHPHSLTLEDSIAGEHSSGICCASCEKKISPKARAYYCAECCYGVHPECVVPEEQPDRAPTRRGKGPRKDRSNRRSAEPGQRGGTDEDTSMRRKLFQHT